MSQSIIPLSPEQLTSFDLDTSVAHADALNQHHYAIFKTLFPKVPNRWLSHFGSLIAAAKFRMVGCLGARVESSTLMYLGF